MASFLATGAHFYTVQFHQKYKEIYGTFEEWAQDEFGITRQRAYEIIQGFKIVAELSKFNPPFLPANDWQARQLVGLELDSLREAWAEVTDNADNPTKVTAAQIARVAQQYRKEDRAATVQEKKNKELADDAEMFDPNEPAFDVPPTPNRIHDAKSEPLPVTPFSAEDPFVLIYAKRFMELMDADNNLEANLVQQVAMKMIELAVEL